MREQIQERLAKLRQEYEAGRAKIHDLEATMHRIEGAIMVLQELLSGDQPEEGPPVAAAGNGQGAVGVAG